MTREELNQNKQQEIFSEERYEKRKRVTLFIFKLILLLVVGFLLFYFYVTFVSTKILSVREYRIVNSKLPDNFNGLKVIHFSDLHYGTTVFADELTTLIDKMNERNPEIVIFTGDLIDANYNISTSEQEMLIKQLKKIDASLGKYAVYGDEDSELFETIMKQSGFDVLKNSYDLIYKNGNKPIILIGLGSTLRKNDNVSEAFNYFQDPTHNSEIYTITLSHEPDSIEKVLNSYYSNLFLSGHSHNGTVRFPFVGGLYDVEGASKYPDPNYYVGNTKLFVSGGVGTNGPGFRLFCRPSFNFFRISSK